MSDTARAYYQNLLHLFAQIEVTNKAGACIDFYEGIGRAGTMLASLIETRQKIMFIGNGASASISSHMAADFSKNGKIRAVAFNDIALLTAVSNDLGYEQVFENPLERFADKGDVLVAISSSGHSENILRATRKARIKECGILTLSGFHPDNPLRMLGDLNFYVPAPNYGPVEVIHHAICHGLLDTIMKEHYGYIPDR